jgi:hypothetical protein
MKIIKTIIEKHKIMKRFSSLDHSPEVIKERNLIIKSRKINEIFKGKNKIEGKYFDLKYSKLKMDQLKTEGKFDSELINVKKILKEINEKTKDPFQIESKQIEMLRLPSLKKVINKQNEQNSESKCRSDSFTTEKSSLQFDRKTKLSFNSTTTNFSLPSILSCCLFPSAVFQSYTSIIASKNDKDFRVNFTLKEQTQNDRENKSIRRPLKKDYSLKDFEIKIMGVENQAIFCKNLNKKSRKPDRNIRYGKNNY